MFKFNIRFKLTLWFLGILGVVTVISGTLIYLNSARHYYKEVDIILEEEVEEISNAVKLAGKSKYQHVQALVSQELKHGFLKYAQVLDKSGKVIEKSEGLVTHSLPINPENLKKALAGQLVFESVPFRNGHILRVVTLSVKGTDLEDPLIVQLGASLEAVDNSIKEIQHSLFLLGPFILALCGLASYLMAGKALRPIEDIVKQARDIRADDLSQRIWVSHPKDEIGKLAGILNDMLSRLEHSFNEIRHFTASASHELITPVAIMRCGMEVALTKARKPRDYQKIIEDSLEELGRISRIIENLFTLAKADSGVLVSSFKPFRVDCLLRALSDDIKVIAESNGIEMRIKGLDKASMQGDETMLRQLFLNLLDNGIKFTPEGGAIELSLIGEKDRALFIIEDTGVGISEEDRPFIFDRFYRSKRSMTENSGGGMGLSICKWIVEAHGGEIEVESQLGRGTTFTVSLPKSQPLGV
jgi:heavy metal sensor kinase